MASHLGEVDEEKVNNMSYVWFNLVLQALGKRLDYESVINLMGNAFAKDAAKAVSAAYPLRAHERSTGGSGVAFANMAANITILDAKGGGAEALIGCSDSPLGDIGWIKEAKKKE